MSGRFQTSFPEARNSAVSRVTSAASSAAGGAARSILIMLEQRCRLKPQQFPEVVRGVQHCLQVLERLRSTDRVFSVQGIVELFNGSPKGGRACVGEAHHVLEDFLHGPPGKAEWKVVERP